MRISEDRLDYYDTGNTHTHTNTHTYIMIQDTCTVKLVYNDHPRDPEFLAVVDRWSLFRGNFIL